MTHTLAKLDINSILVDEQFQNRVGLNKATVSDYQLAIEQGATLPPIDVYIIDGQFYVVDGFHRLEAQRNIGCTTVEVILHEGDKDDASRAAIVANQRHGLPRSPEDKRLAVLRAINDPLYGEKSDNQLARLIGVSQPFVSKVRTAQIPDRPLHKFTRKSLQTPAEEKSEVITLLPHAHAPKSSGGITPEIHHTADEIAEAVDKELEQDSIRFLLQENDNLRFELAVVLSDDPDFTRNYITELETELQNTKRDLNSITMSRDFYMTENAQLKRQVAYLQKQQDKLRKNAQNVASA
jgi:hypothetical protein